MELTLKVSKIKIKEITISNGENIDIEVKISAFDDKDHFVGSFYMNPQSSEINELISELFIAIENKTLSNSTINFNKRSN